MPLTADVFWGVSGLLIAILLVILGFIWSLKSDIAPLGSLAKHIQAKAIDKWLDERRLTETFLPQNKPPSTNHHSLSPDKAARRNQLIEMGKAYGLTSEESAELQALLQEDARNDLANGLLNVIAFGIILIAIGAIIKSLSKS